MKRKPLLLSLLALVMALSLLTGCGAGKQTPDKGLEPLSEETQITAPEEEGPQSEPAALYRSASRDGWQPQAKENTVMIYMVGSDLESGSTGSSGGAATMDLEEIMDSGVDTAKTNVVIYTGGCMYWQMDIPSDTNTLLEFNGAGFTHAASTTQLVSMGEASTLTEFLDFTYSSYPADHYSLIFWDHGGGPMMGFGSDELFGSDGLDMFELYDGLSASVFGSGIAHLDWVGFDACLMGSIEVANVIANFADYMVASEELEPGFGWDYSFLSSYNDLSDPALICGVITGYFGSFYDYVESLGYPMSATLSVLDLSEVAKVNEAVDALFSAMSDALDSGSYSRLAQYRQFVKCFGLTDLADRGSSYDLIDLGDLADVMMDEYPSQAIALSGAVSSMVEYEYSNQLYTSGVSIYYPYDSQIMFEYIGQYYYQSLNTDGYNEYMKAFTDIWLGGSSSADWRLSAPILEEQAQELTMQLSGEQLADLSSAYYTILEDNGDGTYTPVLEHCTIEPDENGVLHVPLEQELFFVTIDGEESYDVWSFAEIDRNDETVTYNTTSTGLSSDFGGTLSITVSQTLDNEGTILFQNIGVTPKEGQPAGKYSVDLSQWGLLMNSMTWRLPTYSSDDAHMLLPYTQWEQRSSYTWTQLSYQDSFGFEKRDLRSTSGTYVCQILAETTTGEVYASELAELAIPGLKKTVEQKTANGTLTFHVYQDHAELCSYVGTDTAIAVPETVEGKSVTAILKLAFASQSTLEKVDLPDSITLIQPYAFSSCEGLKEIDFPAGITEIKERTFSYCRALTELVIPDHITGIGPGAFSGCRGLVSVQLPETLTTIGDGAFRQCSGLAELTIPASVTEIRPEAFIWCDLLKLSVADGSECYQVLDGVLYTADGKTVIAAPEGAMAGVSSITIPEGVEEIYPYAFYSLDELTSVSLPGTLRIVGEEAFYGCTLSEQPELPDSLEFIGHAAFDASYTDGNWDTVRIGEKVTFIGTSAFGGRNVVNYDVAENNPSYASPDGFLTNKSGGTLLSMPTGKTGDVVIPEGVIAIWSYSITDSTAGMTSLTLPESLVYIHPSAGLYLMELEQLSIGKNLSTVDFTALRDVTEFRISGENKNYTLHEGVVYTADMTKLLLYPAGKTDVSYTVPEGVLELETGAFYDTWNKNTTLQELNVPASLTEIWYDTTGKSTFDSMTALERINVAEGNQDFSSRDGMLYDVSGKTLFFVPRGIIGDITVPDGTETIYLNAFGTDPASRSITLPEGVKNIQGSNFFTTYSAQDEVLHLYLPASLEQCSTLDLTDDGSEVEIVLHVPAGSYAERFAQEQGLEYVTE